MARESVVHLILFVAVVSITTVSVGMLVTETSLYAGSVLDEAERDVDTVDAEIAIVNDPAAGTTYDQDNDTVRLYVKNVGGSTLDPERLDVLLDGAYVEPRSTRVLEAEDWLSGRILEITLDAAFETGDHRTVVEIDGARDVLEFEHRVAYWQDPSGEPGTSDCDADSCTVDAGETETLDLTMGTDPVQDGESVAYAVNNSTVATVDPDSGVTNASGQNETTLALHENGTVDVSLDTGWDEDVITITVVNVTEPFFAVKGFQAPGSGDPGETITVNATVENNGSESATQTVEYRFDGTVENTTDVTLAPDESTLVEFTYTLPSENGTYEHGIYSDDDGDADTITVGDPPTFEFVDDPEATGADNDTVVFGIRNNDPAITLNGVEIRNENANHYEYLEIENDTTLVSQSGTFDTNAMITHEEITLDEVEIGNYTMADFKDSSGTSSQDMYGEQVTIVVRDTDGNEYVLETKIVG